MKMPTVDRAIWLDSASIELNTRKSPVASDKAVVWPGIVVPSNAMAAPASSGTTDTRPIENSSEPLARSGRFATEYSLSERRMNISCPSKAATLAIWHTLSHSARWPNSGADSTRAASENIANETIPPPTCSVIVTIRPCVTSRRSTPASEPSIVVTARVPVLKADKGYSTAPQGHRSMRGEYHATPGFNITTAGSG